jgi:hypothetical protein
VMNTGKSILDGTELLVDPWLGLTSRGNPPLFRHKSAAIQLSKRTSIPSPHGFLMEAYSHIDHNWHRALKDGKYSKSKENWRFEKRTEMSPTNSSEEVGLERAIVRAADDHWANQVPTSSGLVGRSSDKTRNIDLVQHDDDQNFTFIELNVKSNNPLFAAIEILLNGLLFIWSRNNASTLYEDGLLPPVLTAKSITLCVLAPIEFYECDRLDLTNLCQSINQGLELLEYRSEIPSSFEFSALRDKFNPNDSPQRLLQSAENRTVIWQPA